MNKKLMLIVLALSMALSMLASCGSSGASGNQLKVNKKFNTNLTGLTTEGGTWEITKDGLHSNASLMIAEGVDIVTVANLLGHANANTTQRIYAHQIRSAQAAAVDTVGAIHTNRNKTTA